MEDSKISVFLDGCKRRTAHTPAPRCATHPHEQFAQALRVGAQPPAVVALPSEKSSPASRAFSSTRPAWVLGVTSTTLSRTASGAGAWGARGPRDLSKEPPLEAQAGLVAVTEVGEAEVTPVKPHRVR